MKRLNHILIFLLLFISSGLGQDFTKEVEYSKLRKTFGLYFYSDELYSGLAFKLYENGQKQSEGTLKNGSAHGLATTWYENGQKKLEALYKDDKLISLKEWNENGSVKE